MFEINPHEKYCSFDPSLYGDNESLKVYYEFPCEKMTGMRQ